MDKIKERLERRFALWIRAALGWRTRERLTKCGGVEMEIGKRNNIPNQMGDNARHSNYCKQYKRRNVPGWGGGTPRFIVTGQKGWRNQARFRRFHVDDDPPRSHLN
jgi:hypothetical protein